MRLLFATSNLGKLAELRALVGDRLEVVSAAGMDLPEVVEDQETFRENAQKKALAAAAATSLPALADDSGLCVDALGGRPGVRSARYAPGDDLARVEKLLAELEGVEQASRRAAFVCALCLALPDGRVFFSAGECQGAIAFAPRGKGGFGYDPIFEVAPGGQTMAELSSEQKNALSHRGRALRAMAPTLELLAQGNL